MWSLYRFFFTSYLISLQKLLLSYCGHDIIVARNNMYTILWCYNITIQYSFNSHFWYLPSFCFLLEKPFIFYLEQLFKSDQFAKTYAYFIIIILHNVLCLEKPSIVQHEQQPCDQNVGNYTNFIIIIEHSTLSV